MSERYTYDGRSCYPVAAVDLRSRMISIDYTESVRHRPIPPRHRRAPHNRARTRATDERSKRSLRLPNAVRRWPSGILRNVRPRVKHFLLFFFLLFRFYTRFPESPSWSSGRRSTRFSAILHGQNQTRGNPGRRYGPRRVALDLR